MNLYSFQPKNGKHKYKVIFNNKTFVNGVVKKAFIKKNKIVHFNHVVK